MSNKQTGFILVLVPLLVGSTIIGIAWISVAGDFQETLEREKAVASGTLTPPKDPNITTFYPSTFTPLPPPPTLTPKPPRVPTPTIEHILQTLQALKPVMKQAAEAKEFPPFDKNFHRHEEMELLRGRVTFLEAQLKALEKIRMSNTSTIRALEKTVGFLVAPQ